MDINDEVGFSVSIALAVWPEFISAITTKQVTYLVPTPISCKGSGLTYSFL